MKFLESIFLKQWVGFLKFAQYFDCSDTPGDNEITCDPAPVAGMETKAWIISKEDYDEAAKTFDATGNYMKTLVLLPSDEAYAVTCRPGQITSGYEGSRTESGFHAFNPSIVVYILNTVDGRSDAKNYAENEWVIICEQKFRGTNNVEAFLVFGTDSGLIATVNQSSEEMDGLNVLTFAPREGSNQLNPPYAFTTDETSDTYVTDKAYLNNLLTPSS